MSTLSLMNIKNVLFALQLFGRKRRWKILTKLRSISAHLWIVKLSEFIKQKMTTTNKGERYENRKD